MSMKMASNDKMASCATWELAEAAATRSCRTLEAYSWSPSSTVENAASGCSKMASLVSATQSAVMSERGGTLVLIGLLLLEEELLRCNDDDAEAGAAASEEEKDSALLLLAALVCALLRTLILAFPFLDIFSL